MALFRRREIPKLAVYMSAVEFSQMLAVFETLAPRTCLEWGSGGSTRALLEQCPFIERYVSIEHDPSWYEAVRAQIQDPRLDLHCILPDVPLPAGSTRQREIEWCAEAESNADIFRSYVQFPKTLHPAYDAVIVDGRARSFCLRAGHELLRPGGILLLHDAERQDYQAAVASLGRARFLEPWSQGQICLIRKP